MPLTTCFARDSISQIKAQGFEEVKVASYDCASYLMVREFRDSFDYIYVSTGETFDEEIKKTHKILSENNSTNFAFLHCVTKYPTPNNMMNMARLDFLKNFSDEVGFSDHSDSNVSGLDAAKYSFVRGATILERHFTILDKDLTKDGKVSINPKELKELKDFAENESLWKSFLEKNKDLCEEMEGSMTRELSDEEISNRIYYRGRFASSRNQTNDAAQMIFNWEETSLK